MQHFANDDDPLTEDEFPDEGDGFDDDDETDLVRCGHCGAVIADDSPQCPHCKMWGPADGQTELGSGPSRLIWAVIVLAMIGVILVMWHGLGR